MVIVGVADREAVSQPVEAIPKKNLT